MIVNVVAVLNLMAMASSTAASIEGEREEVASSRIRILVSPMEDERHR